MKGLNNNHPRQPILSRYKQSQFGKERHVVLLLVGLKEITGKTG